MTYELTFVESAQKEWCKLTKDLQRQFKNKLVERLVNPRCPKDKLLGMQDCYKIKLRSVGYRLVYKVIDARLVVQVIAIGRRDKNVVYNLARKRM